MDFFKSSNDSFGVSSSISRSAPREPGKSVAAMGSSVESRLFVATASPTREVKAKTSFGGGFYQPKRGPVEQPLQSEVSAKFNWRSNDQIEEEQSQGQDVMDSLEHELERLKRESYYIKDQKPSKNVRESLLHLDPTSHKHTEEKPPEELNLAELERMRSRHAARLVELEAEYILSKEDRKTRRVKQDSRHGREARRDRSRDLKEPEKTEEPSQKQTFISKYEAKFGRYLTEKLQQKRGREIKGNVVWAPTVQEQEDDKNELKILVKYMFNKLDKDFSGQVDRVELLQEVHANPELAELFNLKSLVTDQNYVEKFNEMFEKVAGSRQEITLPELYQFFNLTDLGKPKKQPKQEAQKPKVIQLSPRKEKEPIQTAEETVCLLKPKHLNLLESLYNYADEHQDFVVSRRKLYDTLMQDERVIKLLAIDAVHLTGNQQLSLETMLEFMLQDGESMDELITWKQFLDYFYTKPDIVENEKGILDPRMEDYDLPEEYMQIIQDQFDAMPRHTRDKVSTYKFLTTLRRDPQVKGFLSMRARETHKMSDVPGESLSELLDRIEEQADALITWHEVLGFFSRRGKPEVVLEDAKPIQEPSVGLRSPVKPVFEAFAQTVDFDTAFNDHEKAIKSKTPRPKRHNRSFDHLEHFKDAKISYKDTRSLTPRGTNYNITIPQPFHFDKRELNKKKTIRQQKVEEMVQEKELELLGHINFKYRAKAVPAEVVIPRYEGIKASQEARRYEVKRTSKERTKSTEKPFNFYVRDLNKEPQKPPPLPKYEFKAKAIPWEVSVPLYHKMSSDDKAARDERIAKAAQESLSKAKLPPRMEMHEQAKSQAPKSESLSQGQSFKAKDPPDFTKLQKKFADTLEAKKETRKPTEQKPFNFTEIVRAPKPEPVVTNPWEKSKISSKSEKSAAKPVVVKTTKKMEDTIKKKQEQKLAEETKKQAEIKAEEDRKLRLEQMKPRVQSSQVVIDKNKVAKEQRDNAIKAAKQKFKEQDEDYARSKEAMMARISSRPLLVEQATSSISKHNARLKALMKVKESLSQEGVNSKPYLDEEERGDLEDAENLVKVG